VKVVGGGGTGGGVAVFVEVDGLNEGVVYPVKRVSRGGSRGHGVGVWIWGS
jgi:hypothetical protein